MEHWNDDLAIPTAVRMHGDELFAYASGKYLELESMVRRLSETYGIPYGEVLHDVVSGFDDIVPEAWCRIAAQEWAVFLSQDSETDLPADGKCISCPADRFVQK